MSTSTNSVFDTLTGKYALSKTLRFELKPIGKTQELLDSSKGELFPKDKKIHEIYQNIIKPKLNELHSRYIEQGLSQVGLSELDEEVYEAFKMRKKEGKVTDYKKKKKKLRSEIKTFLKESQVDGIESYTDLCNKKATEILVDQYGDEVYTDDDDEKEYISEELLGKSYKELIEEYFKNFSTYLTNFHQNRKNLYKTDGKQGRVATRTIDENLTRFLENKLLYEKKIQPTDLTLTAEEKEIFDIVYFNDCLNQEGIDRYNQVIGGGNEGINSKINRYNQKNGLTGRDKLPTLQVLYKQILADVGKQDIFDFIDDSINSYEDLAAHLKKFMEVESTKTQQALSLLQSLHKADITGIWIKKGDVKKLSHAYFANWSAIDSLLPTKTATGTLKKEDEVVSLDDIKEALHAFDGEQTDLFKEKWHEQIVSDAPFSSFIAMLQDDVVALADNVQKYKQMIKDMFGETFATDMQDTTRDVDIGLTDSEGDTLKVTKKNIVKKYLENVLFLDQAVHHFELTKGQGENKKLIPVEHKDTNFYNEVEAYQAEYKPFKTYNAVRNFLTKKPYSTEKYKVNFDNGTLLDGRDRNKETDNYGVLLQRDGRYYLAVMKKGEHFFFDTKKNPDLYEKVDGETYQKVNYKLLPGPNKMLPKVFFSKKRIDHFNPSDEIVAIREQGTFKQGDEFSLVALHKRIDFMKQSLAKHPERSDFDFNFPETASYDNIANFYNDVAKQGYKLETVEVSKKIIDDQVAAGDLYLFQIHNKDFPLDPSIAPEGYTYKGKGKDNLHTMYRKALFSDENLQDGAIFKLNGQAEIFFRPKSIEEKQQKDLNQDNPAAIKHKRFTEPKLFFHCPLTINFCENDIMVNDHVNALIRSEEDVNVIGIDRGEKHLLYYSLVDKDGNVVDGHTGSLNTLTSTLPDGKTKKVNYHEKLDKKEQERDRARRDWGDIEQIKDLKAGYLSQVVRKLVDLAIEYNAVIVLEDLNRGFKRGRQKIEKQVYQKFELALAKKLNYLVFKERGRDKAGGVLHGYQLTPPVENFQDMYKQTGILFYTQAGYTSTTCPDCGFRKNLPTGYNSIKQSRKFIRDVDIKRTKDGYTFSYDLADIRGKLTDKKKVTLEKTERTVSTSNQQRLRYQRNQSNTAGEVKSYHLTDCFDELFAEYKVDTENIVESILSQDHEKRFYKSFMFYLSLLVQLRNADSEQGLDYIQCPSCGFHSDDGFQGVGFDGDANGAYNIARKGAMLLEKIRQDAKKYITYNEWDNYTQN